MSSYICNTDIYYIDREINTQVQKDKFIIFANIVVRQRITISCYVSIYSSTAK